MDKWKTIIMSDLHLGAIQSNTDKIIEFLDYNDAETIILNGDIIDGWLLKRRIYWPQSNTNVIRKILSYSKGSTKVIYIPGNHDEFLREYGEISFGNIEFHDEYVYKDIFITHGDLYDGVVKLKWLGIIGSVGYDIAIVFDRFLKKLGNKRSLSKYLKDKVKGAIKFITSFEDQIIYQGKKRKCKNVVCGHIHFPIIKEVDDMTYINCGDWIENNTYVIYNNDKFTLHAYKKETDNSNPDL